jgi:hypothetical protein
MSADISSVISIIDSAAVIEGGKGIIKQSGTDMYNGLLQTVLPYVAGNIFNEDVRKQWEKDLRDGEIAWAEKEYPNPEDRVGKIHERGPKKGEWKLSRSPVGVLPNPYTSAKSVIGNAIASGINPLYKGKSALAAETAKKKEVTPIVDDVYAEYNRAQAAFIVALQNIPVEVRKDIWERTISWVEERCSTWF